MSERENADTERSFTYEPVWCTECENPVVVTMDHDDVQPMRFECNCTAISPAVKMPEEWKNVY